MAYTTKASCKGGRDGRAMLENGALALSMTFPKELGGSGEGHNPEQLFALGYSSCFNQAVIALSKKHGVDGQAAKVTCAVTLDKGESGFFLKADLTLAIPGVAKEKLQALIEEAHTICPYSKATRGNIDVTLSVA